MTKVRNQYEIAYATTANKKLSFSNWKPRPLDRGGLYFLFHFSFELAFSSSRISPYLGYVTWSNSKEAKDVACQLNKLLRKINMLKAESIRGSFFFIGCDCFTTYGSKVIITTLIKSI